MRWGDPLGVKVKALNCGTVVSEFELQHSCYYVHLGKVWTPLFSQPWLTLYHYCSSRRIDLTLNNPNLHCSNCIYIYIYIHMCVCVCVCSTYLSFIAWYRTPRVNDNCNKEDYTWLLRLNVKTFTGQLTRTFIWLPYIIDLWKQKKYNLLFGYLIYELCWKSIETEAVFTKREMNNEWNVDFLQNTSCVEKVSRLKLYLPREKWTMNETLIFFKIRAVLKKYRDWSCIYQERNEQWMKRWFSSKYELCWQSIETEAVFPKREIKNEGDVDFLQNTSCVEKVSRLKLYFPREKWTTLIFFKIRAVLKKYRDWRCIYQERNEQWMKRWFSSKYELCWKSASSLLLTIYQLLGRGDMVSYLSQGMDTPCLSN